MIAEAIEGSITKTSLKKLRLHCGVYERTDAGALIINYGTTMIYLILKSIKWATRISDSKLKYEIEKQTLSKFGNNVKDLLDEMSSNYSIILDKKERH